MSQPATANHAPPTAIRRRVLLAVLLARPLRGWQTVRVLRAYRRAQEALRAAPVAGDVASAQITPRHARAVIRDCQAGVGRFRYDADEARAGVERVGQYLREYRLLHGTGVSVPQVLEKMKEVNPGFGHGEFLLVR